MQTTSKLLMFSFYISDFGLLAFILLKFTRSVIAMHCVLPCYYPWGNAHLLTSSHHLLTKNPYGVITERIRLGLPCSGQQNESNLANEYHWVSLITHTNAMQEWSGFCPHKENGFSYASTCRFSWKYSICTDDWELSVEWWVGFCWQLWNVSLMDCQ